MAPTPVSRQPQVVATDPAGAHGRGRAGSGSRGDAFAELLAVTAGTTTAAPGRTPARGAAERLAATQPVRETGRRDPAAAAADGPAADAQVEETPADKEVVTTAPAPVEEPSVADAAAEPVVTVAPVVVSAPVVPAGQPGATADGMPLAGGPAADPTAITPAATVSATTNLDVVAGVAATTESAEGVVPTQPTSGTGLTAAPAPGQATALPTEGLVTSAAPTGQPTTAPADAVPPAAPTDTAKAADPVAPQPAPAAAEATAPQPNVSTAPAAATATPPAPTQTAPNPVAAQVFPEVTRLLTLGDGSHRVVLKLYPEALGEVRVVLTVRQGEVQVRLAGSEAARAALAQGAPELHRLLEAAGATTTQITVGDQTSTGHDERFAAHDGQQWGDREHTDHRDAGTRLGDTSARDGDTTGTQQRPADPGTRTLTGVDVTM